MVPLLTEIKGLGFTVTVIETGCELKQPTLLAPITEYEVDVLGAKARLLEMPPDQV